MTDTLTFGPARDVLGGLRETQADTPFLALGQTALWDEPTKAALRVALEQVWPAAQFVAGVHDTDYFAKLPGRGGAGQKYALATHDDARTRGLWSAAGEMHRLFGSEDVPSRDLLAAQGVSLHRALHGQDDPQNTLSALTRAWGWTGIIYTQWDRKIARDVSLSEILPTLLEQIAWATDGSRGHLRGEPSHVGETLRGWVQGFADAHPNASLTDLYRDVLPRLHALLLGTAPANLGTTVTSELLRFNSQTCQLPRFAVVGLFANPATRAKAAEAYDLALAHGDTYTLDQFGEGAAPFDLVVPDCGRGTLRFPADGTVAVDLPRDPLVLKGDAPIRDLAGLAALIERELGSDCVLVGKAVSLIPMLAASYSLVFHEGASGYTPRSRQFVGELQARGLSLPRLHPILRVRYHTFDALEAIPDDPLLADLPPYLTQALGRDHLTASDFAGCWRNALAWETARLAELSALRSPAALLGYLNRKEPATWGKPCRAHEAASEKLRELRRQAIPLQHQVGRLYLDMHGWRRQIVALEAAKGAHFRTRILPLMGQEQFAQRDAALRERAEQFEYPLAKLREQVRTAHAQARRINRERRTLEVGPEAQHARQTIRQIEADAEHERARLTANALRTINGLPHQNARPSSWWFPLVDPSGAWFRQFAATAEYALERLDG